MFAVTACAECRSVSARTCPVGPGGSSFQVASGPAAIDGRIIWQIALTLAFDRIVDHLQPRLALRFEVGRIALKPLLRLMLLSHEAGAACRGRGMIALLVLLLLALQLAR